MASKGLGLGLALAALVWVGALVVAARVEAVHGWGLAWRLLSDTVYTIGGLVCHQRPERSFSLWGAQFPVCARCAGIYGGAAAATLVLALASAVGRTLTAARARAILAMATVPSALTLIYEWTTGSMPSQAIRLTTGICLGAAAAWIIVVNARASSSRGRLAERARESC